MGKAFDNYDAFSWMPLDHVEDGAMVYPVSSYDDERAIGMRIRVATEGRDESHMALFW